MSGTAKGLPDVVVFSAEEIQERVGTLAQEIEAHYPPGEEILVIGLLKGAFIFVSDLVRALTRPEVEVDFLIAALYRDGTDPSGDVQLLYESAARIAGRHVLLVEDIVDSGKTLGRIGDALTRRAPRSLEVCALLHKRRTEKLRYEPRWIGFEAPADWLVGYGLDYGGRYRHLPFIAALAGGEEEAR